MDLLREGIDIPATNYIALLRPYAGTRNAFANLLQNLGRGTRPAAGKPHFRLYDYTGFSRVLRDGLGSILVEPPAAERPRRGRAGTVTVDEIVLDVSEFRRRYFELFPEDGSFEQAFPFFDYDAFASGALADLHAEAHALGVTGFTNDFGPRRLALRLATALPDVLTEERDDLLGALEKDWNWFASDGAEAKEGKRPPCQRIYRALHAIASLAKLTARGRDLDLSRLHRSGAVAALLDVLMPDRPRTLRDPEKKRVFLDPLHGALAAMEKAALDRGLLGLARGFGARDFALRLASGLPPGQDRDLLLARLRGQEWRENDGRPPPAVAGALHGYQREAFQRVYGTLHAIATVYNRNAVDPVDLDGLHTWEQGSRLAAALLPPPGARELDEDERKRFLDPELGGLKVLSENAPRFGVRAFSIDHGMRDLVLALAGLLPAGTERGRLLRSLRSLTREWRPYDGGNAIHGGLPPLRRLWTAVVEIAAAVKAEPRGGALDLDRLWSREGMTELLDLLVLHRTVPPLADGARAILLDGKRGALGALAWAAGSLGVTEFVREHGALRIVRELGKRVLGSYPRSTVGKEAARAVAAVGDCLLWGWRPGDGSTARGARGAPAAARIYRALYVLAAVYNEIAGQPRIALDRLHSREEMERFLDWVLLGRPLPALRPDDIALFRDRERGALNVLVREARPWGVPSLYLDSGHVALVLTLARRLPASPSKERLLRALQDTGLWGWSASDVNQAVGEQYFEAAARKLYRALAAIALEWNASGGRPAIDPAALASRAGAEALLRVLAGR